MILYRVMSLEEFEAYKAGKTIRARNGGSASKSHNCWHRPMICFFTSANNCAHWRPICACKVSMIYWRMKNERVKIHGQHRA